jgi:hypothetical protein
VTIVIVGTFLFIIVATITVVNKCPCIEFIEGEANAFIDDVSMASTIPYTDDGCG